MAHSLLRWRQLSITLQFASAKASISGIQWPWNAISTARRSIIQLGRWTGETALVKKGLFGRPAPRNVLSQNNRIKFQLSKLIARRCKIVKLLWTGLRGMIPMAQMMAQMIEIFSSTMLMMMILLPSNVSALKAINGWCWLKHANTMILCLLLWPEASLQVCAELL